MRRRTSLLVVLASSALVLTGCGASGPTEEETASLATFAETSCSGISAVYEADDDLTFLTQEIEEFPTADEQHAAAVAGAQEFIDLIQQSRDDVVANPPMVEEGRDGQDGDAIVALFTTYYDAWIDQASSQLEEFSAEVPEFGPNENGVTLATIDLVSDINQYSVPELVFPYSDIEDQDVIEALDEEPACEDVVTIW